MKNQTKRIPQFYKDGSGIERARMPLARPGTFATLNANDLRTLLALGVSANWYENRHGYVAVNIPGTGPVPVARLVIGAGEKERVSYADGDKLNLQVENLTIGRKHERRVNLAALLAMQAETRKARESAKEAKAREALGTAGEQGMRLWRSLQAEKQA